MYTIQKNSLMTRLKKKHYFFSTVWNSHLLQTKKSFLAPPPIEKKERFFLYCMCERAVSVRNIIMRGGVKRKLCGVCLLREEEKRRDLKVESSGSLFMAVKMCARKSKKKQLAISHILLPLSSLTHACFFFLPHFLPLNNWYSLDGRRKSPVSIFFLPSSNQPISSHLSSYVCCSPSSSRVSP